MFQILGSHNIHMEGCQPLKKRVVVTTQTDHVLQTSPNDDRVQEVTNYPSSSQSSQHANKKRPSLENRTPKRDSPPKHHKGDLPGGPLPPIPDHGTLLPTFSLPTTPLGNPLPTKTHIWGETNSVLQDDPYGNIKSPFQMELTVSTTTSLPPLQPLKLPSSNPLPPMVQSLPSISTVLSLIQSNPPSRLVQSTPNLGEITHRKPTSTSFLLPNLADSYNPLNTTHSYSAPPIPPPPTPAQSHSLPKPIGTTPTDTSLSNNSAVRFPLSDRVNALNTGVENNRFVLLEQPNEIQRKSYKNESRYLLPNPLTICLRSPMTNDNLPPIIDGTVSVKIINADGNDLPTNMQHILESLGGLTRPLDEERSASFSLKVSATSINSMYRLLFTVNYRLKSTGSFTETILSTPFSVCSNRKKQLKELKERLNQLQRKS